MKKALLAIFLVLPAMALAEKQPANGADYTVAVHVQSSRLVEFCSDVSNGSSLCNWEQVLSVVIDGNKYELESAKAAANLLRLGDYKAKITKDESAHAYEYNRTYEFLFPDGQTRQYIVVGETQ
ncbi:MAG: hypothetical protein ABSA42_01395 [Terracidiphilus sp.]